MAAKKEAVPSIFWKYKHYWLWPMLFALIVLALILLSGSDDAATPYIYNIH